MHQIFHNVQFWIGVHLLVLVMATCAIAQKTDIIMLDNDDRLTGEIKGLRNGKLELKTDNMSTVYIKWYRITQIKSDKSFKVELEDHRSTRLSKELTDWADIILLFDFDNLVNVLSDYRKSYRKTFLLGAFQRIEPLEIEDPFGKELENFRLIYSRINAIIQKLKTP